MQLRCAIELRVGQMLIVAADKFFQNTVAFVAESSWMPIFEV